MRIQNTPPTSPFSSNLYPDLIIGVSNRHRPPQDRGARSTDSTASTSYTAGQRTSHRSVEALDSVGACDRSCAQVCPPVPVQSNATASVHRGVADTQADRLIFPSTPYPQEFHASSANMTIQWGSEPPPLNFSKSPYRCIPLPQMTPGPATLNPILAYTDHRTAQNGLNDSQRRSVDVHRHHICAPATNPSVGSVTILLPDRSGITVHASHKGHSFVTVGDVLDALDTMLLGKPSRELSLPVGAMYGGLARSCPCLSGTTALHSLRNQYERAGLMRNEEGFDIWDLWVG